ncbi:MAG: hypothetical protein JOZ34_01485 [Gammaproteobacteria bacterium]|nr:hypothetical protein [Gammaproteobacteria bacterium]
MHGHPLASQCKTYPRRCAHTTSIGPDIPAQGRAQRPASDASSALGPGAAKTATAIEGQIRLRLRRRSLGRSAHSIHENSVQIWVLKGGTALTSKLVGFVHNPDVDPAALIELTSALLAAMDSQRRTAQTGRPKGRLLIEDRRGLLPLATYQNICAQLRLGAVDGEILVSLSGGRVQKLSAR